MKRMLSAILLMLCLLTVKAEEYEILSVHLKDGTSTQFLLSEQPKVTFSELTVNVESSSITTEFEKAKVLKLTYGTGASIEGVKTEGTPFIQQGDKLLFQNLADRCIVTIYNINGAMVQSPITVTNNQFEISISDLSSGVYILKADTQSYKIIKR